jgi:hypothetical protein
MATTMNDDAGEPRVTDLLDKIMTDAIRAAIAEGRVRLEIKFEMFVDAENDESAFRPRILIEPT